MPRSRCPLLAIAAAALAATLVWVALPYARLAWARTRPRADAELAAVSADGTRMIVIERPSLRAFERDAQGERPLRSRFAVGARLGPGVAYIAGLDLFGQPNGSFIGIDPQCALGPDPTSPWSMPVWRADGLAMFRRTSAGIVFDGLGTCVGIGSTATSAAFVGQAASWTDGRTVWIDGRPVWHGTSARLLMAAGTAWLLAAEGFAELTESGVLMLETNLGLASLWEMPHGVCLVDDSPGDLVLANPPEWGSKCWRPGSQDALEHARGKMPVDVDVVYDRATRVLRGVTTGAERVLPASYPVLHSTRVLPNGALRSFEDHGYWELDPQGVITEVRWGADGLESVCSHCAPTWREPAEIR